MYEYVQKRIRIFTVCIVHPYTIYCFFTYNLQKVLISNLCMNSNQTIDTQCTNCRILIRTWPKLLLGYPSGYPNIGISLKPRFRLRVRIVFWLFIHHVRIAKNVFIHQCTNSHDLDSMNTINVDA